MEEVLKNTCMILNSYYEIKCANGMPKSLETDMQSVNFKLQYFEYAYVIENGKTTYFTFLGLTSFQII